MRISAIPLKINNITSILNRSHSDLQNLTADDHTQYALLAGRAGGQTLIGDTASGGNLTLQSTAHANRGKIYLGSAQTTFSDESTGNFTFPAGAYIKFGSGNVLRHLAPGLSLEGNSLNGSSSSGGNLTIGSTSHATKGKIIFGTSAYDEVNNRFGIGTPSPSTNLHISGSSADVNTPIALRVDNTSSNSNARVGMDFYINNVQEGTVRVSPTWMQFNATNTQQLYFYAGDTISFYSGNGGYNKNINLNPGGTGTAIITAGAATGIPLTIQGASSQSGNLTEWKDSLSTILAKHDANGWLGIGNTTSANTGMITLAGTSWSATQYFVGASISPWSTYNPGGTGSGGITGINGSPVWNGTNNTTGTIYVRGLYFSPGWNSSITAVNSGSYLAGVELGPSFNASAGTLPAIYGAKIQMQNDNNGTITNAYNIRIGNIYNNASGLITNNYGIYIDSQTRGATLNYAIYTNAGLVHFGDNVDLAAAKTLSLSGQVISTLATGTSPLSVTSTTVNTNLNADMVDGNHVASGVYTPSLTNGTNVAASTAYECQYIQVGNVVTVSGKVDIDQTAAGVYELGISLPVASNLGAEEDCAGTGAGANMGGTGQPIYIKADATNNRASFNGSDTDVSNHSHFFSFTYQII